MNRSHRWAGRGATALLALLLAFTALGAAVPLARATGSDSGDGAAIRQVNDTFTANYRRNAEKYEFRRTIGYVVFVGAILFGALVTAVQAISAGGKRLDQRVPRVMIALGILVMTVFVGTRDTLFPTNPAIYSSAAASIRTDLGNYRTEAEELFLVLGELNLADQVQEHRAVRARYRDRMDSVIAAVDQLEKHNLPAGTAGQPGAITLVPTAFATGTQSPGDLLPPDSDVAIFAQGSATAPALAESTEAARAAAAANLREKLSGRYLAPLEDALAPDFRNGAYGELRGQWLADAAGRATVYARRLEKTADGIRTVIVLEVPKREALTAYLHEVVLARSVAVPEDEARAAVARSVEEFLAKSKDWASVRGFQLQMKR